MKTTLKKVLAGILASTCVATMVACGGSSKEEIKGEGNSQVADDSEKYNISGTVNYAILSGWYDETRQELVRRFEEKYPNITVNVIPMETDAETYLTTAAATGELPDILEGAHPIIYPLSTGLVQPLDEFLVNDPDIKNVPQHIVDSFRIEGKVYGVPVRIVSEGLLVNLDLLENLNLDKPEYDWDVNEFKDIAKRTTNKTYSAIDTLGGFNSTLMANFDENLALAGYNFKTQKFDFTSGAFKKQMDLIMELKSIPGLEANSLINNTIREDGKEDDYQKKFGKEVDGFNDGKVAMKHVGTWDLDWLKPNFNYDFYTMPTDSNIGYRATAEADYLFMLNTAKDKEATFELLKWMSYGEEGVLAALDIREGIENPIPFVYLPANRSKAIQDRINNIDMPEGLKYFYNNLDKTYAVPQKLVPGYPQARGDVLNATIESIVKGEVEAGAVAAEMEEKANEIVNDAWTNLKNEMSKYDAYK